MRQALLAVLLMVVMVLSACSNNSAPASHEEVQEKVQSFYNEMTKFDQMGKSSLDAFNTTLTSFSSGKATDKELEKAIDQFQDTASDIADEVKDVKISKSLPENIQKLLKDSMIAFQSAYSIKEQASKSAASPDVTADEFKDMNQQADVAMLYGISKLNEARVAAGLIEKGSAAEETLSGTDTSTAADTQANTDTKDKNTKSGSGTSVTDVK
ncbi:hypothetical protein A3844_04245 [Paenibacillus helianthi]|uniref:Inhibitor of growth protein N-terminal histone-binding domain-containing protein n=1 Tax=Paenibacillus helianthi TaxID=1349432 RepID=A0ABX3ET49_9BACL|nr:MULTISPECIES: hypothetical protein [Paenibacillus]OKP90810.1 hypothetical protein A3842_03020 [Paenibacillus sp. P3E]OKP91062.1 hypothetical protein A3844_04245 [Paenibacillus helianthi]